MVRGYYVTLRELRTGEETPHKYGFQTEKDAREWVERQREVIQARPWLAFEAREEG